ncbi:hypothetical protein MGN70_001921 [Eutypa lata]|nr:hypothetical protein MGN70_001921 [Eutypa lata]
MGPEPTLDALIANPDAQTFVIGRVYDASQFSAFAEYCYQQLNLGEHLDRNTRRGTFTHLLEDKRTVRMRGSRHVYTRETRGIYQIKLEAAKLAGYRAMYLGAHKDPVLIGQMDKFIATVKGYVKMEYVDVSEPWELEWHIIGKGDNGSVPQDVALIGEALAPTQELATSLVAKAKIAPSMPRPCAEFCIYHLVELKDGEERGGTDAPLFRFETFEVGEEPKGTNEKTAAMRKHVRVLNADPLTSLSADLTLSELAIVIRSKNSGPYEITFDVMFDRESIYRAVKNAGVLRTEAVAKLFDIPVEHIVYSRFFDQARAYKVTTARLRNGKRVPAGGYMEDDVHGSQMYLPLMEQKLPEELRSEVQQILDRPISTF